MKPPSANEGIVVEIPAGFLWNDKEKCGAGRSFFLQSLHGGWKCRPFGRHFLRLFGFTWAYYPQFISELLDKSFHIACFHIKRGGVYARVDQHPFLFKNIGVDNGMNFFLRIVDKSGNGDRAGGKTEKLRKLFVGCKAQTARAEKFADLARYKALFAVKQQKIELRAALIR